MTLLGNGSLQMTKIWIRQLRHQIVKFVQFSCYYHFPVGKLLSPLFRFRGRILTQPSFTPLASFNVIELDEPFSPMSSNGVGSYGDKDDWAVFMQKVKFILFSTSTVTSRVKSRPY